MADKTKPDCYGKVDVVFPMTGEGYREIPERCMEGCEHSVDCLKKALNSDPDADKVREEQVDRAYDAGLMGFFERWSKKKMLKSKSQKR